MKKLFNFLFVLFLCTFIFSATYIVSYLLNSYQIKRSFSTLYDKLENSYEPEYTTKPKEDLKANRNKKTHVKSILPKYQKLYNENKDMIGWIKINNTPINYPVMQTKNNPLYYLHKDWYKHNSSHGVPFIDARNTLTSNNLIIYAHNMKDGSMFGSLKNYCEKEYYLKHSIL